LQCTSGHFGALTEVHKHYKYNIHTDVLPIIREQDSNKAMQFNTLKILATALDFISSGEFSQLTVSGVFQQVFVTM